MTPFVINWPALTVTFLIFLVAAGLVIAQVHYAGNPASQLSLINLAQRVPLLESTTNWVQRDEYCVGLSALGRELDEEIPPDARVFMSGMLGKTNGSSLGYYYFMRNYLFPRHVEISLDGKAVFTSEDCITGVPCDSASILRSNGFDFWIKFANNKLQFEVLTPRGEPRQP